MRNDFWELLYFLGNGYSTLGTLFGVRLILFFHIHSWLLGRNGIDRKKEMEGQLFIMKFGFKI